MGVENETVSDQLKYAFLNHFIYLFILSIFKTNTTTWWILCQELMNEKQELNILDIDILHDSIITWAINYKMST